MQRPRLSFILHTIMVALILVIFINWILPSPPDYPTAEQGVLDLSQWSFESNHRVTLSGEWEFNWEQLLLRDHYSNGLQNSSLYVPVPSTWNRYALERGKLPEYGYATYHLKVILPESRSELGLRISPMATSYRLYVNDRLVAQNGLVGISAADAAPQYEPRTVIFTPPAETFDLIIQVSNYTYARGGIWYDIDFGSAEQIRNLDSIVKYKDAIVIGILSMLALFFFFTTYIFKMDRRSHSFLLLCLTLILRTSLYGDYLIVRLFPHIPFRLLVCLTYLTVIWFPVFLYSMIAFFLQLNRKGSLSRPFYLYAIGASVFCIVAPVSVFTAQIAFFDTAAFFIYLCSLLYVFYAHKNKISIAGIVLLGCVIVGLTGAHDMLYQANLIRSGFGELAPIGLICLMMLLFLMMAQRFTLTYRKVEALSQELSEKLRREQELTERLYALDKLKDEFLTNTSHELRTPLNGIINITQSIIHGIGGHVNKIQRQNLDTVLSSARKLHVIINDLLDVSLLRSGGMRITQKPLNIFTLSSNLLVLFQHLKKNDRVRLRNEISEDFPLLFADETRLRQILNNLLSNALKATGSGFVSIGASHDGAWAEITVSDTGIGIPEEMLENLFHAFEQVDGTLQRKHEEAGLGLYITRQLVELHGGSIRILSASGKGTQVSFTIPLFTGQEYLDIASVFTQTDVDTVLDALDPSLPENEHPFEILAVDSSPSDLRALSNMLRLANYNVKSIGSGKVALSLLENGIPFDLVILDAMMPELSGFQVLEHLRSKYSRSELPVLMLISKGQPQERSLGFRLGANDYLTKPFEVDELMARVAGLVRLKNTLTKLTNSEISFLQAQIKPHFIHNALSVISSLSIKDPPKAKSLILDLSDYLRGSFDLVNEQGMTTLSRELNLVHAYISIEEARFKDRLKIFYHLEEGIDCMLPLLTIQPLVENAIRHGILCRTEGGEVHLTTSLDTEQIRIEVRDNGVGMKEEAIRSFFEMVQDQAGVGMANIHRRLIAHYGAGLHIESAPGQGTVVYFYIPYHSSMEVIE